MDFRISGPKASQPYLTMSIPIVTFSFPDTYEHAENQLNSFIHYWDTADNRVPTTLKATPIFDHAYPITIKFTFGFPEYVLACKKSARFIHSFRESYSHF